MEILLESHKRIEWRYLKSLDSPRKKGRGNILKALPTLPKNMYQAPKLVVVAKHIREFMNAYIIYFLCSNWIHISL